MNRIPNQPFSVEIVAVYGIKSNPFYLILSNEVTPFGKPACRQTGGFLSN